MTDITADPKHQPIHAVADRFAARLLKASIEVLNNQRTLWPVTPQAQQQEIIDRLREQFADIIRMQMIDVAAGGFVNAEVMLGSLSAKGNVIKAQVDIADNKTLHQLVDQLGRKVVLVLVDAETYALGMESIEAMKDQPDLPLENPGAEPPAGIPVRCTCAAQVYDPIAKHKPDCAYMRWFLGRNDLGS